MFEEEPLYLTDAVQNGQAQELFLIYLLTYLPILLAYEAVNSYNNCLSPPTALDVRLQLGLESCQQPLSANTTFRLESESKTNESCSGMARNGVCVVPDSG